MAILYLNIISYSEHKYLNNTKVENKRGETIGHKYGSVNNCKRNRN